MSFFIMAAAVPAGTQLVFVQAESRRAAVEFTVMEIRKEFGLPKSHTVMPTVIDQGDDEAHLRAMFDALSERFAARDHDYEPSTDPPHPMHSDPPCRVCGQPKKECLR